jgi:hypothetical protein
MAKKFNPGLDVLAAAQLEDQSVRSGGDVVLHREAAALRARATEGLGENAIAVGVGAELVLPQLSTPEIQETVRNPSRVTAGASYERTKALAEAGILEIGLDLAQSFDVKNSLERMMCHQLAATHHAIMRTAKEVAGLEAKYDDLQGSNPDLFPGGRFAFHEREERLLREIRRHRSLVNRGTVAFAVAVAALQRTRKGGTHQKIVVERVNIDNRIDNRVAAVVNHGQTTQAPTTEKPPNRPRLVNNRGSSWGA